MNIPKREMKDGNRIPAIGFGTWRLKGKECRRSVGYALKAGYSLIDTAELYKNESEIGDAIREVDRDNLFIISKPWLSNMHWRDVIKSCKSTLDNLGTGYLDMYLVHWPNGPAPIGETLGAMSELQDRGLIRSVGVSNFSIEQLKEAMEEADIDIAFNQVEFHPWLYQKELLEFCRNKNIVMGAHTPLAGGDVRRNGTIKRLAEKYGKTPTQIALRWEIQKGAIPMPRSSSEAHINENTRVFGWELNSIDVEKIDSIQRQKRKVNMYYGLGQETVWKVIKLIS